MTDQLIFLNHNQLSRHAGNMRRTYPTDAVRKMGMSQLDRAREGKPSCLQPLVVTVGAGITYDPAQHTTFTIVAGHLRHAGNAWLGEKAPPLPCIVRYYATDADMLADMGTENGVREDVGVIGWAQYLKGQLVAGVPMHLLLRRTGLKLSRVERMLEIAEMPAAVQNIFDRGELPLNAAAALKQISNRAQFIELATQLGQKRATIAQVEMAVKALQASTSGAPKTGPQKRGRKSRAQSDAPALDGVPEQLPATLRHVRRGAKQACEACEVGRDLAFEEPAWRVAVEAATNTCRACDLKVFETVCKACPLAEAMRNVVKAAQGEPA